MKIKIRELRLPATEDEHSPRLQQYEGGDPQLRGTIYTGRMIMSGDFEHNQRPSPQEIHALAAARGFQLFATEIE